MIKKITGHHLFMPLLCLAIVLLTSVSYTHSFFEITVKNGVLYGYIIDIINRASELVILAIGMTLVASSSGGTDISVGAIMAVTAAVVTYICAGGQQAVSSLAAPLVIAIVAGLIVSLLCGMWNGFLVAKLGVQPMVATLILYTAGRGIAQLITGGQNTYIRVASYKVLGSTIGKCPIPTPIFIAVITMALSALILKKTALGTYIQTVGINSRAAKLVGLKPVMIQFLTYTICGLFAGIAGVVASSRIYSCDANNIGLNIELDAILAVALGGNSLAGGKFSLAGSIIGAYTIQALTTTLYSMGVSADVLPVYKAIVVVIIVSLQSPQLMKFFHRMKVRVKGSGTGKEVA